MFLEKLVLAHKDLAHRVVREDVPDGVGEDRGYREHVYLALRLVPLLGKGSGNDGLLYRGLVDPLVRWPREDRVGRRCVYLRGALLEEALRCSHGIASGI